METLSVSLLHSEVQLRKKVEKPIFLGLGLLATLVSFPKMCQQGFPMPSCWASSQEAGSHSCITRCLCPILSGRPQKDWLELTLAYSVDICGVYSHHFVFSHLELDILRSMPGCWGSCCSVRQTGYGGPCHAHPPWPYSRDWSASALHLQPS